MREARARAAWLEVRRTEEGGAADEMFANACTTSMTKPAFQWKCFAGGERRAFSACTSALAPASSIFPKTNLRSARTSSDSAVDAPTALGDRRQRCLTTAAPSLSRPAIMTLRSTPTKHPAAMRRGSEHWLGASSP